jgi:hypothetical protein
MEDVIKGIDRAQLATEVPLLRNLEGQAFSYLDLGRALWCDNEEVGKTAEALGFGPTAQGGQVGRTRLWDAFVAELFSLICTKDGKYRSVRSQVQQLKGQPAAVVVATISGAIGATLGLGPGVIAPFVALLLHGAASLGVNTMCSHYRSGMGQV